MRKALSRSAILAGRAALLGSEATARPAAVGAVSVFKAFYNAGVQPKGPAVPANHGMGYHHAQAEGGYAFFMPNVSLIGPNSLQAAGERMKKLNFKKALIVTDEFMSKSGAVGVITDMLQSIGMEYELYDKVVPNPTDKGVEAGLELLHKKGCDCIVSFGGGSSHDNAKAIGIVASNGGTIHDYEGIDVAPKPMMPLISINTTAGTASEMTRFCIITDSSRHVKMAIVDSKCTPTIAVDDPNLMVKMPKGLTAATGMDAMTHAVEAYVSTISNPLTDASSLHAIRLISTYLRRAVANGGDMQARDMMSYAQFLAGMAFNSASLGYVHAMAHQLGGFYDLPHGVCNAVLLPVVQEFNAKQVPELYIDMAEALGHKDVKSADQAVSAVLGSIRKLSSDVGIPKNLKELGVKPEDFDVLAENALKDACGFTNPRPATHADIVALFRQAYEQGEEAAAPKAATA
ncbi:hypothetical protein N2152v2_003382 [Parachlorella kessleri]